MFGRQPDITAELTNDHGEYETTQSTDKSWKKAEEIRAAAKKALTEVDSNERLQRALRARPRRAREECVFDDGEPVFVWRQGKRGAQAKVGPCFVVLQRGDTVWVTRRGELWKCNKAQVFKMGNLEKQGLEAIPIDLLRAKGKLSYDSHRLGYIDVDREGPPDLPLEDEESVEPQRPAPQVLPAPHGDQDRPREQEPILRKAPGTPRGPPEGLRTPNPSTGAQTTPLPAPSTPRPATTASTPSRERSRSTPPRQEKTPRAPETEEPALHDLPAPSITTSTAGASDELWKSVVENKRSRKSQSSSSHSQAHVPAELREWSRVDIGAKRFRTSNSQGPLWSDVVRRITRDLMNDRVVDDEDITEAAMAKKLYRRLPDGIEDIETTLVYQRVEGHPDPGKAITTEPPGGQVKKDDRHPKQEDARLIDAGMKRSLEGTEQSRATTRSEVFGTWRADDVTEWGDKRQFPVICGERDLVAFARLRTSDIVYNERDIHHHLAYLTKQSGKELSYQRLTPEERVLFDAAKLLEISNLENSNAISIVEDAKELDRIRQEHPGRIMPSRFIFTKKAGEVGEGWKAKTRWILLGHRDPDAAQLERYAPTPS